MVHGVSSSDSCRKRQFMKTNVTRQFLFRERNVHTFVPGIYRLNESSAQSAEDRKEQDIETCLDLIRNTLEVDCRVEDLKQVFRLGQRNRTNNDSQTNIRPILIESMQPKIRSWNHCIN